MRKVTITIDVYEEYFDEDGFLTKLGKEILDELGTWQSIKTTKIDPLLGEGEVEEIRLPK